MLIVYLTIRLKRCWLSSHPKKFPADVSMAFPSGGARVRTNLKAKPQKSGCALMMGPGHLHLSAGTIQNPHFLMPQIAQLQLHNPATPTHMRTANQSSQYSIYS